MIISEFTAAIEEAATVVDKTWPLYGFVTANPLSGYEHLPFGQAVREAKINLGASALPSAAMFRQAFMVGEIDHETLTEKLRESGRYQQPDYYLEEMEVTKCAAHTNETHELDRIISKWLSAYMDEGMAEWEMPGRAAGFFTSWRRLAVHDRELRYFSIHSMPHTAVETIRLMLKGRSKEEQTAIFKYHLSALPGWTGYIKYRMSECLPWQQQYPITLEDYLAVRLWFAGQINRGIQTNETIVEEENANSKLELIWLRAWESTWQKKLAGRLQENLKSLKSAPKQRKSTLAQMVFCIDTRSELIRRHIEAKGHYETFGYAGFFGIATDYCDPVSGLIRKSCPPILDSAYTITESALTEKAAALAQYQQRKKYQGFINFLNQRLKNMLPSAFGYVEGTGLFYGFSLLRRTFFPAVGKLGKDNTADKHEDSCVPQLKENQRIAGRDGINLKEKAAIVKSAFDLLGWKEFAPLVIFAGHAGQSANNPFKSSLDCGACAASPGRHNARMLAEMANQAELRALLKSDYAICIPAGTFFLGAEHNTATDELAIFDAGAPASHLSIIRQVKLYLADVQRSAVSERLGSLNGPDIALKKAVNWAETRPEWGLAGNAGFIIAPRALTRNIDLESRCFLHSYDWETDDKGLFLEMIMQGPMVVAQWINNHYYFSTVDNERFGGGSKITHNVTGNFGVVQGNGGDLKAGLPLQSVNSSDNAIYHHPLRLSVLIHAPAARIEEILLRNNHVKKLVDNEWIYLMVMDPLSGNQISLYHHNCD
ncbi:DUF2309 domain-containing protein [Mucilaginibacter flavidus]|uniref:DUF2309 domain-containing protein n=1 Tax=Mucilaginibacter flavidus TaxID=2949309 RepID=UPI00209204E7|nr:DUF2309 domain-containing protein [Mucilaginibacter flavidus]MCO5947991.1 DUF2309 domain-containing protein [Mucilaginibacter flavidus]